MGLAEVVPGVSGGTIAFVAGIYERLINAIKNVDGKAIGMLVQGQFKSFFYKIDGVFLSTLVVGMAGGLITGVFAMTYCIENYPVLVWSLFFGLILASAVFIANKIQKWNWFTIVLLLSGTAIAYFITVQSPVQGTDAFWAYGVSGMIAISALILPGISGSFMLLIMGMYTLVLGNVKSILTGLEVTSIIKIAVFGLGAIVGLALFSRVLSWTFKRYRNQTYAVLTGFILGSLNKIWPWKLPILGQTEDGKIIEIDPGTSFEGDHIKIIQELNISPFNESIDKPYVLPAILCFIIGLILIYWLSRYENTSPET